MAELSENSNTRRGRLPRGFLRDDVLPRPIQKADGTTFTLPQLLKLYAREHDRRFGDDCPCILCADYRAHLANHRAKQAGAGR